MGTSTLKYNDFGKQLTALLAEHMPEGDEKITFRLLQAPSSQEALNSENQRFVMQTLPSITLLKRVEKIVDPDLKRTILLARVVGERIENGHLVPDIESTIFRGDEEGIIQVGADQPELLARLLFSDENADSPNPSKRRPAAGYLYGIVRPDKEASKKLTKKMRIAEALREVDDLANEELAEVSGKLSLPTQKGARTLSHDELRLQLAEFAEGEPDRLLSALDAQERKLQQLVLDGVQLGVLDFHNEAQEWRFKATQQLITPAVHGIKAEEALVAYMQHNTNGPALSQTLVRQVAAARKNKKKGAGSGSQA